MKKFVLSAAASAAAMLAFAGPASAAPDHRNYQRAQIGQQQAQIDQAQAQIGRRIEQAQRNGRLSRAEARSLRNRLAAIQMIEQRYRRGGLDGAERRDLARRLDALRADLRSERRDRNHRRG